MPSKEEVLASIPNLAHSAGQVKHLINSINSVDAKTIPLKLRKGDVITLDTMTGTKKRPLVIIKVLKDISMALPLSTTEDAINLCESSSRFFRNGYFSKQVVSIKNEVALKNFAGVYGNSRVLNNAIREMKKFLIKVL